MSATPLILWPSAPPELPDYEDPPPRPPGLPARHELVPNTFQVPSVLVDRWLPELPGDSVKLYVYLCALMAKPGDGPPEADAHELAQCCGLSLDEALLAVIPLELAGFITARTTVGEVTVYEMGEGK